MAAGESTIVGAIFENDGLFVPDNVDTVIRGKSLYGNCRSFDKDIQVETREEVQMGANEGRFGDGKFRLPHGFSANSNVQ